MHALHHVSLFGLMAENAPRGLIPIDKCKLTASLVKENGLDHAISAARVGYGTVKSEEPEENHDWQHDGVGPIERIFLDQHR